MAETTSKTRAQLAIDIMDGVGRKNYKEGIANIMDKAEYANRQDENSIVSGNTSVRVSDGNIDMATSQDTSMKLTGSQIVMQSHDENHTTNRVNVDSYDVVVNGHKLNPNLWEYADFKTFKDQNQTNHAIGGFCLFGTVLTPSWDSQLHRYVLIRRLARMPMFSPKVNVPDILPELNIDDPTKVVFNYKDKQHTETAEQYQKKVAKQVNDEKSKNDEDAKEKNSDDSGKQTDGSEKSSDKSSETQQVLDQTKMS